MKKGFRSLGMLALAGGVLVSGAALAQDDAEHGAATEEQFKRLDQDGDGYISKSEAENMAGLTENFDDADIDKNGQLDQAEFAQFEIVEEERPTD